MHISEHIRITRKKALLTQSQLADLAKVNKNTIVNAEKEGSNINLNTLADICDALDYELKIKMVKK